VPRLHQAAHHVPTHSTQSDHSELHVPSRFLFAGLPGDIRSRSSADQKQALTFAFLGEREHQENRAARDRDVGDIESREPDLGAAARLKDIYREQGRTADYMTMLEMEAAATEILSPGEPHGQRGPIPRLDRRQYRRRVWATRKAPWVDRLACAWLIKRHIDNATHETTLDAELPSGRRCYIWVAAYMTDGRRLTSNVVEVVGAPTH
jgi:hypothetical protein